MRMHARSFPRKASAEGFRAKASMKKPNDLHRKVPRLGGPLRLSWGIFWAYRFPVTTLRFGYYLLGLRLPLAAFGIFLSNIPPLSFPRRGRAGNT